MALMYGGMTDRATPGINPPATDAPMMGSPAAMVPQSPQMRLQAAASQIMRMKNQLMDMQRTYGMMQLKTSNPQQLFAMQSEMQKLQQQIQAAEQAARQEATMGALKYQSMARGMGSMSSGGGRGGVPNQGMIDRSREIQALASMFSGNSGAGSERMW